MAMIDHEALTLWRERSGLSKTAFAKATNISLQYLCDIEGGKRKLNRRPELIKRFAETLDIPVTYLERR
jgi:transcriptional regulator with XRE-family HTH domain